MSNLSFTQSMRGVARTAPALIFALFFGLAVPLTRAQTLDVPSAPQVSKAFVVYQSPEGDVVCRDATAAEAEEMNRDSGEPLQRINHLKSDSTQYGPQATAGLTIVLNGSAQLNANPAAKQAFIAAAAKWEALISTPITVTIDVDFGTSAFGTAFPSANILGLTSSSGFLLSYSSVRQQLISHASAGEEASIVGSLPASSLPTDIGSISTGGVFLPPSQLSALGINVGQTAPNPRIGFNSAFGFDFDPSDGVTVGLTDFDSVAVHEIGHALGFVSEAGDTQVNASIWDFYRFKPGTATTANFSTAQRAVSPGVDSTDRRVQFNGNTEVELSTGKPDGTGGDGSQSSHWKHDTLNNRVFIGIMDPALRRGEHHDISANDIRALDFLGYTVTQTTPPSTTTVQFASATQAASETSGSALITITRSGSLAGTSSVGVGTLDDPAPVRCDDTTTKPGVAFARCDYATTVQTVTFAPNETTKTISIPLIDDSFGEPNEVTHVALANPTGATLGAQPVLTLTITSNEAPGQTGANPILNTDFFVRMQYLDFLSREPEVGQPWSATLNNCAAGDTSCDRISVSANFFRSQEFQLKGLFVFRFYKVTFGRLPLYSEIVADMASVTGSSTADLIAKKALFTNAWAQRTDFTSTYAAFNNTQFVNTLMDRYALQSITTPDPATPDGTLKVTLTRADLINRLGGVGGTLTRGQVVRAIADSDQVGQAEFNPAFVAMQYFGYLRRDPDAAGYQAWLNTINANPSDFRAMVNGFMNSTEYRLRFGPQ